MSYWTHIVGVMHVDTYKETDDIKSYVDELLRDAPAITGSERDASVFVSVPPGHNISITCDCGQCPYKNSIRHSGWGEFECDAPEHYDCPTGEYQTRVVITVQGDLRDRMRKETKKEWNAFHRYVAKTLGFDVRLATCRIEGW